MVSSEIFASINNFKIFYFILSSKRFLKKSFDNELFMAHPLFKLNAPTNRTEDLELYRGSSRYPKKMFFEVLFAIKVLFREMDPAKIRLIR